MSRLFGAFALISSTAAVYTPDKDNVNAFVTALNNESGLASWKRLWRSSDDAQFCRNGQCVQGIDNIAAAMMHSGQKSSHLNVSQWLGGQRVLWLKETMTKFETTGGCKFEEDIPSFLYFDTEGKISAMQQVVLPADTYHLWLNAANVGLDCSASNGLPSNNPPPLSETAYTPKQSDVNAYVNAFNTFPVTDPKGEYFGALLTPSVTLCRNGLCYEGKAKVLQHFVVKGPFYKKNLVLNVKTWLAAPGLLYLKDTTETIVTSAGCQHIEGAPQVLYFGDDGKIRSIHQIVLPDTGMSEWSQFPSPCDPTDEEQQDVPTSAAQLAASVSTFLLAFLFIMDVSTGK